MATTEGGTSHGEMTGAGVFREYLLRGMIFLDFQGRSAGMLRGGREWLRLGCVSGMRVLEK
jgi:hypothetical protein